MRTMQLLKAIADETRMKILGLLLKHDYCVRALAENLGLTEATISQHLKIMREAGLLTGEKRGYYMHYVVERKILCESAAKFEELANTERVSCATEPGGCNCHRNEE